VYDVLDEGQSPHMNESDARTDQLRHVSFVGRPTTTPPRPAPRAKPPASPAGKEVVARRTHPPGQFISWVLERAGLVAESYRGEPLGRRVSACLRALHATTEQQGRQILEQRPELLPSAVSALLIGVTSFFRDAAVFDALRAEVLPDLAARGRALRVWSAGCSNGAELYSLAILLAQAGLLEVHGHKSFLLGSDCRHDAMEQARAGLYSSKDLENVKPSDRDRCFDGVGTLWRPIEALRRGVHWKVSDVGRRIEEGPWDLVLWRNMAIYLQPDSAAVVWRGLASVLAPRGVLVVGKAEQPPAELPLICISRCIYHSCPRGGGHARGSGPRPTSHKGPRATEKSE
jgi:chemotaxis methyl-accepting protein methylase